MNAKQFGSALLLLCNFLSYSQEPIKVKPPSPEAASVFKFSEVPVSAFSGLPNISIPLQTINLKELSIPIVLSYHARGLRVAEIAPRVGSGWALSYGGMISRQTRGKADDSGNGYLFQSYYNDVFTNSSLRASMHERIVNEGLDMEPDQFSFDLSGNSGKFIFDQVSKEILIQNFSDTEITPIFGLNGIDGWIALDERGNKFYFGLSKDGQRKAVDYDELTNSYVYHHLNGLAVLGSEGDDRTINTWHIMEIETPFNEHVYFYYQEEVMMSYRRSYDVTHPAVQSYFSHFYTHQQQIDSITFQIGKLKFTSSHQEREDVTGGYSLDKIGLFDTAGDLINEHRFQYHYTTSPDDNNQLMYLKNIDPKSNKRMFLSAIQPAGRLGLTTPPFIFEYNTTPLPNRFSNSQDIWGYYNGAPNGQFLTFFSYNNNPVNREVNSDRCEAGLLLKMTYPTGGWVSFEYEQNFAARPYFMDDLLYPQITSTQTHEVLEGFLKHPDYFDPVNEWYADTILIGGNISSAVEFNFDLPNCSGPPENYPTECSYQVYLAGGGNNLYLYPPLASRTLDLAPGEYVLTVIPQDPSNSSLFNVTLQWEEQSTIIEDGAPDSTGNDVIMAAGKRIKSIKYYSGDTLRQVKDYHYQDSSGRTTGKIFGLPNFYYRKNTYNINGQPASTTDPYGSIPGSPLTNLQGNSVGYSMVTEYHGSKDKNVGKVTYEYTTTEDGGDYYKFPYHLPMDNEWLRGKSIATTYYAEQGAGYIPIRKVENIYEYAGNSSTPGPFMTPFIHADSTHLYSVDSTIFYLPLIILTSDSGEYKVYYLTGGTVKLRETTEIEYERDISKIDKKTTYTYKYKNHYQQHSVERQNSDGTIEATVTIFPGDYASGSLFIDSMIAAHLINYPIEIVTYRKVGNTYLIVGGNINQYRVNNPAWIEEVYSLETNAPIPSESFKFSNRTIGVLPPSGTPTSFSRDGKYIHKVSFGEYDADGNVRQYRKSNDTPVSYVWDYKNRLVVAEIKHALRSEVAYTSFESDGKGDWSFSGTPSAGGAARTGKYFYKLGDGSISKGIGPGSYRLEFWGQGSISVSATGTTASLQATSAPDENGWILYQYSVSASSATTITLSGTALSLVDELKVLPSKAEISTYTYQDGIGLTSQTDNNNFTTYFEYDAFGRLKGILDNEGNVLKTFTYNYVTQE